MPRFHSPKHRNLLVGFPDRTVPFADHMAVVSDEIAKLLRSHTSFGRDFFEVKEKKAPPTAPPVEAGSGEQGDAPAASKRRGRPKKDESEPEGEGAI